MELTYIKNFNKKYFTQYINYLLVAYAFSLPLSKAGTNFFEGLLILLWLFEGNWKQKFQQCKDSLFYISFTLLMFMSFLAVFWSISYEHGIDYVDKYRHFLILFVIFTSFDKKFFAWVINGFLCGLLLSELLAYSIFFELITYKSISPSDPSPFMSHTSYSVYLAFASIISFLKFKDSITTNFRIFYGVILLLTVGNLFIIGGRTGQIIFIVLIFVTFFMLVKNKLKSLIYSTALLVVLLFSAYQFSPTFQERITYAVNDVKSMILEDNFRGSFAARVSLWILGFDKFLENPLYGSGYGYEMTNIGKYAEEREFNHNKISVFLDHHNNIVTFSVQLGIWGLIFSLLSFYALFRLKFNTLQYRIMGMTFAFTFFLWTFVDTTFHLMNSMVFFALFAGLFNRISYIENNLGVKK